MCFFLRIEEVLVVGSNPLVGEEHEALLASSCPHSAEALAASCSLLRKWVLVRPSSGTERFLVAFFLGSIYQDKKEVGWLSENIACKVVSQLSGNKSSFGNVEE